VVEGGLVVTNAHVIAGIEDPVVEDSAGRHRATPVLFDPDLDLAVLRASGLAGRPLTLLPEAVGRGGGTAVLGYPEGGPLNAKPSAILDEFTATGRDIYGSAIVARRVYQLQAEVRSGNSGGPFVEADGDVLGVVFSRSAHRGDIGYSLVSPGDVIDSVEAARSTEGEVGTGPCA
jgi:S1-C subfamily serine protease